jgi:hypothetical protein
MYDFSFSYYFRCPYPLYVFIKKTKVVMRREDSVECDEGQIATL